MEVGGEGFVEMDAKEGEGEEEGGGMKGEMLSCFLFVIREGFWLVVGRVGWWTFGGGGEGGRNRWRKGKGGW